MYFSEVFDVDATNVEWFNPLMDVDTQLFIDPFLIYKESSGRWKNAGDQIAQYFQEGFEILAGHQDRPESLQYRKTVQLMIFPEPSEFGLGYTARSKSGSGTADGFALRIVGAMAEAIKRGLKNLHHFEELGILVDRIGKDRISDIAANILKPNFIDYTQDVCRELGIPLVEVEVPHAEFDEMRLRWVSARFELPVNPETGDAVLLTPKRFLRELPTLDAHEWWIWVEPYFRDDINMDLASKLNKEDIVALARRYPEKVREWTDAKENQPPKPYDVDRDPEGLHSWRALTRNTAAELPLEFQGAPAADELDDFIRMVNDKFRHYVEEQGGWRLLWNDDNKRPKKELGIQLLYKGVVQSYCEAHGVILDREVELGRGPVDFIFTRSASERVVMEIKKADNGEFWNGLEKQLISYMESDGCSRGWFLAVRFADTPAQKARTSGLAARTRSLRAATGFDVHSAWVDARPKKSASNLRPDSPDTLPGKEDLEFAD